jgi:hypothetical protein
MASLLDEESVPAKAVAAPKAPPAQQPKAAAAVKKCPSCSAEITAGAVLCVNCGLDLRTGRPVEIGEAAAVDASEGKTKKRKKKKKKRGDTPQAVMLLRGCAASFGFALLGSFAWWMAAYFWDVEFGIIAWVIGGLAGAGMSFGYGIEDLLSGLAAAAIAFFAIFVAKVLVFAAILNNPEKFFGDEIDEAAVEEPFDQGLQVKEMADSTMPSEDQPASEEGTEGEESTTADASKAAVEEIVNEDEFDEDFEAPGEIGAPMVAIIGIDAIVGGFISMFWPPLNILFLLLACGTAYQVGSGGSWAE